MYKDGRYINAGTNEIYRWGHKAVERVEACLTPNQNGYYSIETDAGKYWTIGTSEGKYGEFAKIGNTIFSVNRGGYAYAKAGTEKGNAFVAAIKEMISEMHRIHKQATGSEEAEEEE